MKKFILVIIFALFPISTFAFSYNGGLTVIYPTYSDFSGATIGSTSIITSGLESSSSSFPPVTESRYVFSKTVEIDFNAQALTGASVFSFGYFQNGNNTVTHTFYDAYFSGSSIVVRLFNTAVSPYNLFILESLEFANTGVTFPLSGNTYTGYYPKRVLVGLQFYFLSRDGLISDETYIQKICLNMITDVSKLPCVNFVNDENIYGDLISSAPGFADSLTTHFNNVDLGNFSTLYYNLNLAGFGTGSFPYITAYVNQFDVKQRTINYTNFRNIGYGKKNASIFLGSSGTLDVFNTFHAQFYLNTGSIISTNFSGVTIEGGGGGTGTGETGVSWYESCDGFTDIGCYITSTIDGIGSSFFPEISFEGDFDSCGSGSSSTGGYLDRLGNLIGIVNPIPAESGSTICIFTFGGVGSGVLQYQSLLPEENWFEHYIPGEVPILEGSTRIVGDQTILDIIVIFVVFVSIFYKKSKHD